MAVSDDDAWLRLAGAAEEAEEVTEEAREETEEESPGQPAACTCTNASPAGAAQSIVIFPVIAVLLVELIG